MAFVLQDIFKELQRSGSLEPLKNLKKTNLAKVAAHFRITPAASAKSGLSMLDFLSFAFS